MNFIEFEGFFINDKSPFLLAWELSKQAKSIPTCIELDFYFAEHVYGDLYSDLENMIEWILR